MEEFRKSKDGFRLSQDTLEDFSFNTDAIKRLSLAGPQRHHRVLSTLRRVFIPVLFVVACALSFGLGGYWNSGHQKPNHATFSVCENIEFKSRIHPLFTNYSKIR